MKTCPYCCAEIDDKARKCKYCGEWVVEGDKNSFRDEEYENNEQEDELDEELDDEGVNINRGSNIFDDDDDIEDDYDEEEDNFEDEEEDENYNIDDEEIDNAEEDEDNMTIRIRPNNNEIHADIICMTDGIAEQLGDIELKIIDISVLDGKITKKQADMISGFNGTTLQITGLSNLNTDIAKSLANFSGEKLQIGINGGIFDDEVLEELVNFQGDYLIISGFSKLDEGQPEILTTFGGKKLGLRGGITGKQYKYFDNYKGIIFSPKF